MHKLRFSSWAWLASTAAFTLAFPFLIFLYRMGGNFWHLYPEPVVDFLYHAAYIEEGTSEYFVSWVAFTLVFGIPIAAVGLGERLVLNRIGRTDYLACALLCGFCAPLALLLGLLACAAGVLGSFQPGWLGVWLHTVLPSLCWLAPFGVAQGLIYRAIAGVAIGKPPVVAAVAEADSLVTQSQIHHGRALLRCR